MYKRNVEVEGYEKIKNKKGFLMQMYKRNVEVEGYEKIKNKKGFLM